MLLIRLCFALLRRRRHFDGGLLLGVDLGIVTLILIALVLVFPSGHVIHVPGMALCILDANQLQAIAVQLEVLSSQTHR